VILSDADYTGLTHEHVSQLLSHPAPMMVIGVPDWPDDEEVQRWISATGKPSIRRWHSFYRAYPWMSGIRYVPTHLLRSIQPPLHGYCTEAQINKAARATGLACQFEALNGLQSPMRITDQRVKEMHRDYMWGMEHGLWNERK
jgi:hypothetical protein